MLPKRQFQALALAALLPLALAIPPVHAAEGAFDPGVPAPKVGKEYYQGADKAVYHINVGADEKGYLSMLGNVRNHMSALKDAGLKAEIAIVMNGDGLGMLQMAQEKEFEAASRLPGAIKDLKEKGVKFEVCYRTLTGRKIAFSQLYDAKPDDLVPSGVAEVARLQSKGYMLVKP